MDVSIFRADIHASATIITKKSTGQNSTLDFFNQSHDDVSGKLDKQLIYPNLAILEAPINIVNDARINSSLEKAMTFIEMAPTP